MKLVKIDGWRDYFTGDLQVRYGVGQTDAQRNAEELLKSLFGSKALNACGPRKRRKSKHAAAVSSPSVH